MKLAMAKQNALNALSKNATVPPLLPPAIIPGDQQEPEPEQQPEPMQVALTTTEEQLRRKRPLDEAGVPPLLPPTSDDSSDKAKKVKPNLGE